MVRAPSGVTVSVWTAHPGRRGRVSAAEAGGPKATNTSEAHAMVQPSSFEIRLILRSSPGRDPSVWERGMGSIRHRTYRGQPFGLTFGLGVAFGTHASTTRRHSIWASWTARSR